MQPGQPQGQPMQPPGQLAQGIAQPMPQQMPQQMAEGGLASIRIDPRMFDYGSGGVVSFAGDTEGSAVRLGEGYPVGGIDDDEETSAEEARARLVELRRLQDVERAREGPVQQTADAIEAQRREKGNYGADTGPLGEEYLTGLKYRGNGKYDKIPHFFIDKEGKILQLLSEEETSKIFNNKIRNNGSFIS